MRTFLSVTPPSVAEGIARIGGSLLGTHRSTVHRRHVLISDQGKGRGMLPSKPFFQQSLGSRRTGHFASTALSLLVLLVIMQSVLPAYAAHARTASPSATLSAGCISPSDCVS